MNTSLLAGIYEKLLDCMKLLITKCQDLIIKIFILNAEMFAICQQSLCSPLRQCLSYFFFDTLFDGLFSGSGSGIGT